MVPCLERIGWTRDSNESHLRSMLRGLLICQLGTRGCEAVMAKCQALFNGWLGDGGSTGENQSEHWLDFIFILLFRV